MRRISAPLLIPAVVGILLSLAGEASARCLHGLLHCGACQGGYSSGYYQTGTPVPFPTPLPTPGPANPGVVAPPPPPGAAPSLPYPGASMNYAASVYGASGSGRASYAAPAYGYGGSWQSGPAASPSSYLDGYNAFAPIQPVAAGTPLSSGHLFGSHIFQVLRQFGGGQGPGGLLDIAIRAFVDASGFMPTNAERAILDQIVARFLRTNGTGVPEPGPTNPGTSTTTMTTGGSNVIRIVVTVEVPPGAQLVSVRSLGSTQTGTGQLPNDQVGPAPVTPPAPPPGAEAPASTAPPARPLPTPAPPAPSTPAPGGGGES